MDIPVVDVPVVDVPLVDAPVVKVPVWMPLPLVVLSHARMPLESLPRMPLLWMLQW